MLKKGTCLRKSYYALHELMNLLNILYVVSYSVQLAFGMTKV